MHLRDWNLANAVVQAVLWDDPDALVEQFGWQHRACVQWELKADHAIFFVEMDHDVSRETVVMKRHLLDRLSEADLTKCNECRIRGAAVNQPHARGGYRRGLPGERRCLNWVTPLLSDRRPIQSFGPKALESPTGCR
jgi:hypothetical protein